MSPVPPPSRVALSRSLFPEAPPARAVRGVLWLRRALQRVTDRFTPAELVLFERAVGIGFTQLLGAVARFGIADALDDAPQTAESLARTCGVDPDVLHRTLRALATGGFFALTHDGKFRHTRLSRALRGGSLTRAREFALYFSSGSNCAAWNDFSETLRTGKSAFDRVLGMDVWQWFDAHPDERENFAHTMMGITVADAPVIAKLYPFAEIRRVCDVGGGRGTLLSELLLRHPHLEGTLAEGEGVLELAKELFDARGVLSRVELAKSNFFEQVPGGHDAYLMKNILHDWDDPTCERILRVVRAAAPPGARLIVCESLVEKNSRDALGCMADLQMMIVCVGGRERGLGEFRALFERAGFSLRRHWAFPTIAVMEAI